MIALIKYYYFNGSGESEETDESLDFSDANNSQYLGLF